MERVGVVAMEVGATVCGGRAVEVDVGVSMEQEAKANRKNKMTKTQTSKGRARSMNYRMRLTLPIRSPTTEFIWAKATLRVRIFLQLREF